MLVAFFIFILVLGLTNAVAVYKGQGRVGIHELILLAALSGLLTAAPVTFASTKGFGSSILDMVQDNRKKHSRMRKTL